MRITILHVSDCPNVGTLQRRLDEALFGRLDVEMSRSRVDSEDLAHELGMAGSPTLLVDGRDPFAQPGQPASVSCRLYRDETGRVGGAPSLAQLRQALDPDRESATAAVGAVADEHGCRPSEGPPVTSGTLAAWRARTAPRDPVAQAMHQAILRRFAATGQPPLPEDLDPIARAGRTSVEETLARLHTADVIRLDPAGRIRVAYPFSATPTRHRVRLADRVDVYAMCAIDALGMPAMLAVDAMIASTDPTDDQPITVTVQAGRYVWEPPAAVVFLRSAAGDGPSADSCCNELNFFSSQSTAQAWIDAHPHIAGEILDPPTAQRLGEHIFGALLDPAVAEGADDGAQTRRPEV